MVVFPDYIYLYDKVSLGKIVIPENPLMYACMSFKNVSVNGACSVSKCFKC